MRRWEAAKETLKKKAEYGLLKRRVFRKTVGMIAVAFAAVWLSYIFIWQGHFANLMVAVLQKLCGLEYKTALEVYGTVFRGNFSAWIFAATGICFFLIFRFFLNWFMKYFNEIDEGISRLLLRGEKRIHMSKELKPMEEKLNQVYDTLERQFLEIQESERKKDELVMYLAHDIRTPLTSVIGYLNLLLEMPDVSDEQREKFIHVTLDKAQRLEVLVNEFFDITRFCSTQMELSEETIDLYYMLMQLKEEAYPSLSKKEMTLRIDADENCTVYGNADKLARVFHNLLKNAISYGDAGSEITVRVEEKEGETHLFFSNHGATISAAEQERLFDKFYRVDAARQTRDGGAGLGLAIVKELVELHGGTIRVASRAGVTTFWIVLPRERTKENL